LVVLVDVFASTLVMPVLPLYAQELGASALGATATISIFSACQLVSGPVLGAIADRLGYRPVLVVSQVGTLGGLLLIATARSMGMVYAGRVIDGLTAGNLSLVQALIAERTPPERRSDAFAIYVTALGIGLFVGPFASAHLVRFGLSAPVYAGAALSALSIVTSMALLPGGRPEPSPDGVNNHVKALLEWRTYGQYFSRPELGPVLRQFGLYTFGLAAFISGLSIFAVRVFRWGSEPFGAREVGYLFAYGGVLGVLIQGVLMPQLTRRLGDEAVVRLGFATFALGQFGLGYARSTPALLATLTLAAFGMNALRPALTSLITKKVGPREQGVVLGVAQSLESLMAIAAPFFGGLLLDRGQTSAWAWLAGAAALLGLAAAWPRERPGGEPKAPAVA
jgi:MFS transporter, DHA1 family, tetracycline resistance protein